MKPGSRIEFLNVVTDENDTGEYDMFQLRVLTDKTLSSGQKAPAKLFKKDLTIVSSGKDDPLSSQL